MQGRDMSDNELAALAGRGDAEAYRRLFERYQHPIYNFVYRMVDNAEDASDIVQNAFLKIYTLLGQREIENFSAYLYRIAKNLAYDEMRRRSRFVDVDHEVLAPEDPNIYADPQRALMLGEQIGKVREAVGNLNENQRAALILRELQELDYDEMSDVLESNRNAVGALLSRARLKFREELRMAQVPTEEIPVDCEECVSLLSPYIDDELQTEKRAWVETHLEECTFCLAALEEMREASRSFRMFIPVIPPADVAQAFTGRLAELAGEPGGTSGSEPGGTSGSETGGQGGSETGGQDGGEVCGQGGGEVVGQGAGYAKSSLISRMVRKRITWIVAAGILLIASLALLLAEQTAGDRSLFDNSQAVTVPTKARTSNTAARTNNAAATTDDSSAGNTNSPSGTEDTAGGTATTDGGSVTPVSVESGYVTPSSVYEKQSVYCYVTVSGTAASVTVSLAPQSGGAAKVISLTRQSASGGTEHWQASASAPSAPGTYYIYAQATGEDGRIDSLDLGTLTVNTMIY